MVQNWQKKAPPHATCTSPRDALDYLLPHLVNEDGSVYRRERIAVLALSHSGKVLGSVVLHEGSASRTIVCPKEILSWALCLTEMSSGLILAHNHPSGDPTPSAEDRALTRKLGQMLHDFGCPLRDHIIVGGHGQWTSLAERGLLPAWGARTSDFI
tara:strand:- start:414 stop:881 length:468 start_codon:yes stop_codon:yes gene_type:complete